MRDTYTRVMRQLVHGRDAPARCFWYVLDYSETRDPKIDRNLFSCLGRYCTRVRVDHGSGDMRVGVVGSRRRTDCETVEAAMAALAPGTIVITGGARGPDRWAEEAARTRGLEVVVHEADLDGVRVRWQAAERFYARNQRIVDDSEMVIAFVAPDRTGGTEDTIRQAARRETG